MSENLPHIEGAACPVPLLHRDRIVMGHGSGGKMTHDLIERLFLPAFDNPALRRGDDSGVVEAGNTRLAFTTDSHVVTPLFFPGGDIGRLAICGTVNDLVMLGARPLALSAGFIIEEGLPAEILQRVAASMQAAAAEAGVQVVTGDTKVVQKGKADGLYINTSGLGLLTEGVEISGANARPGDALILSGPLGLHGIAVMQARGELGFQSDITSDVAPLNGLVSALLGAVAEVHTLRDPTRGGLAATLNEIARQSQVNILLEENAIPVPPVVAAACEMLGLDPLVIANEGKLIACLPQAHAAAALAALRSLPYGREACQIGTVQAAPKGRVLMRTTLGTTRVIDMPGGEILPRIC